ncbi:MULTISPECIES: IMS domain-containing protein [Pseudanabaena]|uniref:IMS domain-containing protein n=1 Tax=Pseudanabaena TaxID=1152 RepID=UPI002478FA8B|nr:MULTISPECIES: IMS domain-containing protein [Pseudanabaena]MEA5487467.1 IMS domain-containing protein [Pseudanabaena sp. CCNP1317]WGS74056.1 IMS domain-containing protein [Pseudanabaena galeata CCNP1313]
MDINWAKEFFVSMWSKFPWFTTGLVFIALRFGNIKIGVDIVSWELIPFSKKTKNIFFLIGCSLIIFQGILLIRFIDTSNLTKNVGNSFSGFFNQNIVYEFLEAPKESEVNQLILNYYDIKFLNSLYGTSYNLEESKKYIIGERYKETEKLVNQLKNKNAYLVYGYQNSRIIRQFISKKDNGFYVDVFVVGTYLYYQDSKFVESKNNYCRKSKFKLAKDGSNLKIARLESVTLCQ